MPTLAASTPGWPGKKTAVDTSATGLAEAALSR